MADKIQEAATFSSKAMLLENAKKETVITYSDRLRWKSSKKLNTIN